MKILCIKSSILKDFSVSNSLIHDVINQLKEQTGSVTVVEKNVGEYPPAHLTLEVMTALKTKDTSSLTDSQKVAYNEILTSIEELQTADLIVIGAPMHNFGISSGLKTWLDQICQAGITFSYTEQGPKGLVENKPTIIVSTRGEIYSTAPYNALDHQETYIKAVLGLIGITDIKYIRAEGVNISPEMKEQAITNAKKDIHSL